MLILSALGWAGPQTGIGGEAIGQVLERVQSGRVHRAPLAPPERLRLPIALALAAPGLLTAGEDLPTPGAAESNCQDLRMKIF